jgi:hypothetical protein
VASWSQLLRVVHNLVVDSVCNPFAVVDDKLQSPTIVSKLDGAVQRYNPVIDFVSSSRPQ